MNKNLLFGPWPQGLQPNLEFGHGFAYILDRIAKKREKTKVCENEIISFRVFRCFAYFRNKY